MPSGILRLAAWHFCGYSLLVFSVMGSLRGASSAIDGEFSERAFFLRAFQTIHLTFVLSQRSDMTSHTLALFQQVLQELSRWNETSEHPGRCLILFQNHPSVAHSLAHLFSSLGTTLLHHIPETSFFNGTTELHGVPTLLWQPSGPSGRTPLTAVGLSADTFQTFKKKIANISLVLRMSRLVWVDGDGGITDAEGQVMAFFNGVRLAHVLRKQPLSSHDPRWPLLEMFQSLLAGGVKAISLCRLADMDQELFTYQGCGSFFSRQPYCHVRRLGLDDFERAANLIQKGEQEGFLLTRSEREVSAVLAGSYGAFILEGHLAGLCALQTEAYQETKAGEIASLYTLTRFQGTGVGLQLLRHLVRDAKRLGLQYLFACTHYERVADFFLHAHFSHHRHGFCRVDAHQVPPEKWRGYDAARKKRVVCLRLNLSVAGMSA